MTKKTKEVLLIRSARYCCICHNFGGVNIEIHHIIPKCKNGPDEIDNLIPVCPRCHHDLGANYNPDHPKGTQYTPSEIIKHRDNWFKMVKEHNIKPVDELSKDLAFKYLICKKHEILKEILNHDFCNLPFSKTFLFENKVCRNLKKKIDMLQEYSIQRYSFYRWFEDDNDYLGKNQNAKKINNDNHELPTYDYSRVPKKEEFNQINDLDPLTKKFLDLSIDPAKFSLSLTKYDYCGGGIDRKYYLEEWYKRPIWTIFLHIKNTGNENIRLKKLLSRYETVNGLDSLEHAYLKVNSEREYELPNLSLSPGEGVIVPCFICLPPIGNINEKRKNIKNQEINDDSSNIQESYDSNIQLMLSDFFTHDYIEFPYFLSYQKGDKTVNTAIHNLNLENVFVINRYWLCGSCPHLFFIGKDGKVLYIKELFSNMKEEYITEKFKIPANICKVMIAELEDETTFISHIKINNFLIKKNIVLKKNNTITFCINESDLIELRGYYITESNIAYRSDHIQRNEIVGRFLFSNRITK